MNLIKYFVFNSTLVAIFSLIFSTSVVFAEPSDKKVLIDFNEALTQQASKTVIFPTLDIKLFRQVANLSSDRILSKDEVTEDRLRVAYLVNTKIDVMKLFNIMTQRKRERRYFGSYARKRADSKDLAIELELKKISGYSVFTLDFIETSSDFWKANNDTLKISSSPSHNKIANKENERVLKKYKKILADKEKKKSTEKNKKLATLKKWLDSDTKSWLTEAELLKRSSTTHYTGNRCGAVSMTIDRKARVCEDIATYQGTLHMSCGKKNRKESTKYAFVFIKKDNKWISYKRLLMQLQFDDKREKEYENYNEKFMLLENRELCSNGEKILVLNNDDSDEMNRKVFMYLRDKGML